MTTFEQRYASLNKAQKQAVDAINGPLLVVAGPGTGKTELLSMRAANILKKTDTMPENILCLTFTDSGANAMRERLSGIIGPNAYKVAIHTFHSFGTEIINHNKQYFYHGAEFQPSDELHSHQILREIFDDLEHGHPLAGKMGDTYTHLEDTLKVIGELKKSGLSSEELIDIIEANEVCLDAIEPAMGKIFANRVSINMLEQLAPLATRVANLELAALPRSITPLANIMALDIAHMFDEASSTRKTTPITAWRNRWMEKDESGEFVFKDRKHHTKLRAVANIYYMYLSRMEEAGLYDFDDMIINVVRGMETRPELRYNLQEKYQYIMVDEFQDTNLAQLRILFDLTGSDPDANPNIMAVGDDDQAIYSFQGADVSNIRKFREQFPNHASVVLTDNYRSTSDVLDISRAIITQGNNRLEDLMAINKSLVAHTAHKSAVSLKEFESIEQERSWVAGEVARLVKSGVQPNSIVILARQHRELISILPHLYQHELQVNYERRDNILELEPIETLELLAHICVALADQQHDVADSLMPQLLSHTMYNYSPESIWRLSLTASRNHLSWIENMQNNDEFKPLASWLIERASRVPYEPLEEFIDRLMGVPSENPAPYVSPYYQHYFSSDALSNQPDTYIRTLESLRTVRDRLRNYQNASAPQYIPEFLAFLELHRQMNSPITSIRRQADELGGAVHLMTAHKSKGLEFDHVFVIGAIDSTWGERVRSRSRNIGYPENLQLEPAGNTYDERLRLFFVSVTRAKHELTISYSLNDETGRGTLPASFLVGTPLKPENIKSHPSADELIRQQELLWHERITANPTPTMLDLLKPLLENYRLSITHLNNFIDVSRGGPTYFLINNLLKFPQAKNPNAAYGTAMHAALSRAHAHLSATGSLRPIEDVLGDFQAELHSQHLSSDDEKVYSKRGIESLRKFLSENYTSFKPTQKAELNLASQNIVVEEARLTGSLDLVDIDDRTITITDYKTGKSSADWKGKTDFERIKLHKYRQQLLFYQLLCENSRDFSKYEFGGGVLQFIEPSPSGTIYALRQEFTDDEKQEFIKLINAVWKCIVNFDLPDINQFGASYKGVLEFEKWLIDNNS